jgi:hypothetical protein
MPGDATERLREHLAAARSAGVEFADAWSPAVAAALAGEPRDELPAWRAALAGTREAWQAAYDRSRPPRPAERALALVAADPEREPFDDTRRCERCAAELPKAAPGRARYCGAADCQRQAKRDRERRTRLRAVAA